MIPTPVPRVPIDELNYVDFVRRFVLTRTPVVLTGAERTFTGPAWSVEYLREHIDADEVVVVQMERPSGMILGKGRLGVVLDKLAAPSAERDYKIYLNTWSYAHTHPNLVASVEVPALFEIDHTEALDLDLRWIYIGEDGTASQAHVDIIASSAWLQLIRGEKHWRFLWQEGHAEFTDTKKGKSLFDLVPSELRPDARLYATTQRPGEIVWTPSGFVHEVRNSFTTVALTHNYVDATNIIEVLDDGDIWGRDASAERLEGEGLANLLDSIWGRARAERAEAWPLLEAFARERCESVKAPEIRAAIAASLARAVH